MGKPRTHMGRRDEQRKDRSTVAQAKQAESRQTGTHAIHGGLANKYAQITTTQSPTPKPPHPTIPNDPRYA